MKPVIIELEEAYPLLSKQSQHNWDILKKCRKLDAFFNLVEDIFTMSTYLQDIDNFLTCDFVDIQEQLGITHEDLDTEFDETLFESLNKSVCKILNINESLPKDVHYEFTINKVADDKLELTSGESTFTIYIEPDDDLQDIQYAIEDFVDTELTYDEDDSENITGTEVVGFKYDQNTGKGKFEANIFFKED